MKVCVYGGHYGSEGKGSLAEWQAQQSKASGCKTLIVAGENSPNSGHTCSLGKTRNIPASSFFATAVLLGPDSVVDRQALLEDVMAINNQPGKPKIPVYIHRHAAVCDQADRDKEKEVGIINRVSSTGSGSGAARTCKQFHRLESAIIGTYAVTGDDLSQMFGGNPVYLLNNDQYMEFVAAHLGSDWIFECSQGTLLDVNFGIFPYVTSRSTLPHVAIERNGLGSLAWTYAGVYRTYPIRTGGPSGATGGAEIAFADIGVPDEIATVTKRIRRVFLFSARDFYRSVMLARPEIVAFTHLDYLKISPASMLSFDRWLQSNGVTLPDLRELGVGQIYLSDTLGKFYVHAI